MLPFLKQRHKEPSIVVEQRRPDAEPKEIDDLDSLEAAVEDLYKAYAARDVKAGATALRAAFQIVDSEPHSEGPHLESDEEEKE